MQVPDLKSPSRKQVNDYLLLQAVGKGASSKVFLGVDVNTSQNYALKQIKTSYDSIYFNNSISYSGLNEIGGNDRNCGSNLTYLSNSPYLCQFEREVNLIRRLKHPSIIKMIEVLHAVNDNKAFIVLEWADCGSLRNAINNNYDFTDKQLASIFKQVTLGLQYLHKQGIAHQDIKPSNLLLFSDGSAKISDFGVGHSFESADTVYGSPAYQAPEFFADSDEIIDPSKEDVWSLGISLYEAKFQRLPYNGENFFEIANDIMTRDLEMPDDVSPLLADLIQKMLEIDSDQRISIDEILEHPFFEILNSSEKSEANNNHSEKVLFHLPIIHGDYPEDDIPIKHLSARVCSEDHSFLSPNLSNSLLRSRL